MSEKGLESQAMDTPMAASPAQAGALLKEAREAQGLHIAALAVALKVPVKRLEALEAGQFEQLPDMVFVRSLALGVCRALRVDPAPIMVCLPEPQLSQFKITEAGLNTTFKDSPGTSHRGLMAQLSSPTGLGVLFLIVAIVVILAWPDKPLFGSESFFSKDTTKVDPVTASQNVPATSASEGALNPANAVVSSTIVAQQSAQVSVADSPVVAVNAVSAPVLPVDVPAVPATADALALPSLLELSGHGESWVQVIDGAGQFKLRKVMQDGEVVRVTGQLPLSVTVGRADEVSVSVRGKPMDLTPLARENVARFEVK